MYIRYIKGHTHSNSMLIAYFLTNQDLSRQDDYFHSAQSIQTSMQYTLDSCEAFVRPTEVTDMQSEWPNAQELLKLAQENPAELEALRQREIEALIGAAPAKMQRRLRGLQFQIDAKRSASKNPMAACIAISEMMFDAVYELNEALNGTENTKNNKQTTENAEVLAFPTAL